MEKKKPLTILEFQAKAVKALKAVTIKPGDKPVVKLTGKNKQGKTSVLDAIWYALGGKSCIPSKPIHDGATEAETYLDLGEFTVTRRITGNGEYLQVQTKDGFRAPKPQEFLSSRLGNRARNPLEFMRLKPDDQVKALQSMVKIQVDPVRFEEITGLPVKGVNLTADPVGILDQAWKHIYEKRTDINKEVKRLEGAVKSIHFDAGMENLKPVVVAELFEERKRLEAIKQDNDKKREAVSKEEGKLASMATATEKLHNEIIELQLKTAKLQDQHVAMINQYQDLEGAIAEANLGVSQIEDPDFTEIDSRIAAADETNRMAQLVETRKKNESELNAIKSESENLSKRLLDLKEYKHGLIQAAGLPVTGLGFDNGEVTYNNFPLSQASGREQIEISCAICAAENPAIGILTVDIGFSELDKDGQEALIAFAKERKLQIWCTKVTEEAESDGFHIVDGLLTAIDGVPVASPGNGNELPTDILDPANIISPADQQPELEKPSWMSN